MVSHSASHLRYLSCSMSGLVGDLTATSNQDVDKIIEEVLSDNISVDRVETTGPPQHIQSLLFAADFSSNFIWSLTGGQSDREYHQDNQVYYFIIFNIYRNIHCLPLPSTWRHNNNNNNKIQITITM